MLFAIKLNYIRPTEEVHAHLESHKAWLVKHVQAEAFCSRGCCRERQRGFCSPARTIGAMSRT